MPAGQWTTYPNQGSPLHAAVLQYHHANVDSVTIAQPEPEHGGVVVLVVVGAGGVFGGMSVFGFVTKKDLTSMGSFLIMCAWGLILASVVNIFMASDAFSWVITYGVLAVFIGLTAYDTQKLKAIALA